MTERRQRTGTGVQEESLQANSRHRYVCTDTIKRHYGGKKYWYQTRDVHAKHKVKNAGCRTQIKSGERLQTVDSGNALPKKQNMKNVAAAEHRWSTDHQWRCTHDDRNEQRTVCCRAPKDRLVGATHHART